MRDWGYPDDARAVPPGPADYEADAVNPAHYKARARLESFEAYRLTYGVEAAAAAAIYNVHKYLYRHDLKHEDPAGQVLDLCKARQYLDMLIEMKDAPPAG